MKKVLILLLSLSFISLANAQECDRQCLQDHLTHYLDAQLKQDPALLPLAENVRFTEDHVEMSLGEGLWASIEGYGTFRQDILDVSNSTAGTHVLAMENGVPVLQAIRLKVSNDDLVEVETTVVRSREEGMLFQPQNIIGANPAMTYLPTPSQRNTRQQMIAIAMQYPEGLRIGSFVEANLQVSPQAYRFENGQLMAGPGCTFFPDCEDIRSQGIPTLAGIQARIAGVDEELGIVWLRMNFGPGSLMRGEGELSVWEMFKIYDGQIQAVEAFMEEVPANTPFGWDY